MPVVGIVRRFNQLLHLIVLGFNFPAVWSMVSTTFEVRHTIHVVNDCLTNIY
jgi:hypothetical protein